MTLLDVTARAARLAATSALALVALPPAALAQTPVPHQSTPVEPYTATTLEAPKPRETTVPSDVAALLGSYQLVVEGASYTQDDVVAGTRTTTSSAGARGRRLVLRADGTYEWGTISGRWQATVESPKTGWPIVLRAADKGSDWKVGWDTRRQGRAGDILLWDGYEYQVGRPLRR